MKLEEKNYNYLKYNKISSFCYKNLKKISTQHFLIYRMFSLLDLATRSKNLFISTSFAETLDENLWGFANWQEIIRHHKTIDNLYQEIKERQNEISHLKNIYRPKTEQIKHFDSLHLSLNSIAESISQAGTYKISAGRLGLINEGISGSYFLFDEKNEARFVIKPLDEDIGALNNRKGFATPFDTSPVRKNMPLYRSSMREYLAYRIAVTLGVSGIAPKTTLAILESEQFFDLQEGISWNEAARYSKECETQDKEKICSAQEFIPNTQSLFEVLEKLQSAGLSDEEIADRFDFQDVEDANILLWTTYDTDGHAGNFLVYSKGVDSIGNEILGLKKIDNGLTFPDKNQQLRNALAFLPFSKRTLSEEGRRKIQAIPVESITAQLENFGLESSVAAFQQRIALLKEITTKPGITLKEINTQMSKIGECL